VKLFRFDDGVKLETTNPIELVVVVQAALVLYKISYFNQSP